MIIIDTREPTAEIRNIIAELPYKYDFPDIFFHKLDHGDYQITVHDRTMLISRKTMSDFCGSHWILRRQLEEMRSLNDEMMTALLIEGDYYIRDGDIYLWRGQNLCRGCSYLTYSSFILSQQLNGTMFFHTLNLSETILRVLYLHKKLEEKFRPKKKKSKINR